MCKHDFWLCIVRSEHLVIINEHLAGLVGHTVTGSFIAFNHEWQVLDSLAIFDLVFGTACSFLLVGKALHREGTNILGECLRNGVDLLLSLLVLVGGDLLGWGICGGTLLES